MDTAHRLRELAGQVFRFGIQTGRCERNIAGDLRGAIPAKGKKNFPAITQPKELASCCGDLELFGGVLTCCAFKLSALFGLRPGRFASSNGRRSISRTLFSIPMGK
jgi:hypothetical protein